MLSIGSMPRTFLKLWEVKYDVRVFLTVPSRFKVKLHL